GLGPNESRQLAFDWTVPPGPGTYILTALADSNGVLTEVSKDDNYAAATVHLRADPALVPVAQPRTEQLTPPVPAALLNYSGVDNVQIDGVVSNRGGADQAGVPVRLLWSRDDGAFVVIAEKTVDLAAGGHADLHFLAPGLAGRNRYRLVVDPDRQGDDGDRTN